MRALMIAVLVLMTAGAARGQQVTQEPAGCLDAKGDVPCKVTYPNGNTLETRANGTTWATIYGSDEPVSFQMYKGMHRGTGFRTNVLMDLPASDVVGAPESASMTIEGDCTSETFVIDTLTDYTGKMGSGLVAEGFTGGDDFERVARRVAPGSAMERLFKTVCAQ